VVVYHTLYIVKGVAVYQQKWLDEQKSDSKAEREAPGDTNPSEPAKINMKFFACPSTQRVDCSGFSDPNGVESLFTLAQSLQSPYANKQTSLSEHNPRGKT